MITDYLGGANGITSVLKNEREAQKSELEGDVTNGRSVPSDVGRALPTLKVWRERTPGEEYVRPLEAEKGEKTGILLQNLRIGTSPADCSPVTPTSDF